MAVVVFLLKIIGIILLVIAGILLLAIFAVCFLPVRYDITGIKEESIYGKVKISWCKFVLCYKMEWKENQLQKKWKIFGIEPKKRKKKNFSKKDLSKKNSSKFLKESLEQEKTTDLGKGWEAEKTTAPEKNFQTRRTTVKKNTEKHGQWKKSNIGRFQKIKNKIQSFLGMITSKWENLKEKIKGIKYSLGKIIVEIKDPLNRQVLFILWKELRYLLGKIKPRKITGAISFSTGDPCVTGQVFGGICAIPCFYGYQLKINPDFQKEESYIQGQIQMKGYILGLHVAIVVIRLLKEKSIWSFLKKMESK